MKLVCLNILGGKYYQPLMDFILSSSADIFCFQEVLSSKNKRILQDGYHSDVLSELIELLPGYSHFFAPMQPNFGIEGPAEGVDFGLAIFVKKSLECRDYCVDTVHEGRKPMIDPNADMRTIVQHINVSGTDIFNFHGIAVWPKTDTPDRITQSTNIRKVLDRTSGRKIVCGDFNLALNTKSVEIISSKMRNLIREFGIRSTRPSSMNYDERISDYIIVSKNVDVKSLEVPDIVISDHLPLVLEFD